MLQLLVNYLPYSALVTKNVTAVIYVFLKAGFRAGDAAPMAYVELVDREVNTSAE